LNGGAASTDCSVERRRQPARKLAGQTAIYGLSTVVGGCSTTCWFPLHLTSSPIPAIRVITEFYAYASFLNVVLTYGMETAFSIFRQARAQPAVYSTALFSLGLSTALFLAALTLNAQAVAELLRYPTHAEYVLWMAW